jgi:ubiquinone/menaquinone biosynthesis C-methylase UbiE
MKNEVSSDLRIRTMDDARRTVQEGLLIDRGFLPNRLTLVVILAALALGSVAPIWSVGLIGVLAFDCAWFVIRRRRILQQYDAGEPRLTEFGAVTEAFKHSGVPEPTMTDWNEVAGLFDVPQWREDLRYRIAASYYRGGVLLDVGCGDGRLCWRYHICEPRDYIGVDVAPGLLKTVSSKTQGLARTVLAGAQDLGLPDDSVDIVICSETLEHLPRPEAALAEFDRVLKRCGRIVIQSPSAMRLRNFNPFHLLCLAVGYWFPAVLQAKVVHANTFVDAFTYHRDFTRQDISKYARASPGLSIKSIQGTTYRFNPEGPLSHRLCARLFRLPVVRWLGGDLTVLLEKQ